MPSKGNTCHLLPGRHSGIGRLIQTSVSPQRRIVVTSPPSGLQEESNKVQTYPHSGFSLLGTRVGHQENESTPATRQDDSNSLFVQKDVAHKFSPCVRTDGPPGQDELCLNGSIIGTIELKTPTTVSTPRQWSVSEVSGQHHLRSKSLPALVDLASKEWTQYQSSRQCSSDRRISERLGCTFRSQTSPRSMVSSSDEQSYQLSRAPGGLLQHWTSLMSHHIIALQIDNTTAVAYLVKEGGTQSKASLCELAAKILNFAEEHRINLRPSYLPGLLNTEADALSRQKNTSDWMLEPALARRIFRQFGRPLIDLFASRRSKQVSKYFTSDRHDLGALGTDALHQNWNYKGALLYAFPPPMLIPLVLAHVHQFRVSGILVTPWWTRAPWIPELMSLSVSLPFRLPERRSILDITYNTELSLPMVA